MPRRPKLDLRLTGEERLMLARAQEELAGAAAADAIRCAVRQLVRHSPAPTLERLAFVARSMGRPKRGEVRESSVNITTRFEVGSVEYERLVELSNRLGCSLAQLGRYALREYVGDSAA